MDIKPIFKVNRRTFFDPTSWIGYELIKVQSIWFWQIVKGVFVPAPANPETPPESFEQVVKRLQLTEKDLKNKELSYLLMALVLATVGIGCWGYSLYLLAEAHFAGCLLSLAVGAFFLGQAFRFHFWRFQIIHRKLGCTFAEWRNGKPDETGRSK